MRKQLGFAISLTIIPSFFIVAALSLAFTGQASTQAQV
jgi:hypothetical protein